MADQQRDRDRQLVQQLQVHPSRGYDPSLKSRMPQKGPSISRVLIVMVLLPVGFTLLALAGITLTGTVIGLCFVTPLFVLFSPVLVPAAITIGLAMAGFFTSGAFGLTALSSFTWVLNGFRQATGTGTGVADQVKRQMAGVGGFLGQKTKEVGQEIQSKAHEVGRTDITGGVKADVGGKRT